MCSGLAKLSAIDPTTKAEFPVYVQYPTLSPPHGAMLGPYPFEATMDATSAPGRFPVCVISHGGGGSPLLYRTIATHLARHGYIVLAPEYPGDNRHDRSLANTDIAATRRPGQTSRAIDAVLANPRFRDVADANRIVMVGHSMGGFTALAMASAQAYSRDAQPLATMPDTRLRAVVLLAPAMEWFLAPRALARVALPLFVLMAEHDTVTPPARIRVALAALPAAAPCTFTTVAGAGHYSFLAPFPSALRRPDFPPANDPAGFDREQFHRELPRLIEEFLTRSLAKTP
jgi:predicted dienelactone hydrolase